MSDSSANRAATPTPRDLDAEWMPRSDWQLRHQRQLDDPAREHTQLVFLGDSISEAFDPELWREHYSAYHPLNLGISGDETQHVLWRLEHGALDGLSPKLVVVLIGTNNFGNNDHQPEEVAQGVRAILGQVRTRLPRARILLMGIFPRDPGPDGPHRGLIERTNTLIAGYADAEHIHFLDIGRRFLDEDGRLPESLMPDYLHPNQAGYRVWAEGMQPALERLMTLR